MENFRAATISEAFTHAKENFRALITEYPEELAEIGKAFEEELERVCSRSFLNIAFVGEYNAGKSTTISALTQRRDIKISADIATDKTTEYEWNGIKLVDTPGLFTERKDHDQITYDAIRQSDLLVFCLTHSLFDSITAENFKKLAYDDQYRTKMLLVVNKLGSEAGDDDTKMDRYVESLGIAIKPYPLSDFPVCFIDARDYIDGQEADDTELIQSSRFETLVAALNEFVKAKGSLAKLDTPIRVAIAHLGAAASSLARSTHEDNAYLEILRRLHDVTNKERFRLRNIAKGIVADLSAQVIDIGVNLSQFTGSQDELEAESKRAESEMRRHIDEACERLDQVVQESQSRLQESMKKVFESELTMRFVSRLDLQQVSASGVELNTGAGRLRDQVKSLGEIGAKVGFEVSRLAQGSKAAQGLLTSTGASGSMLHQGVLTTGKLLGYSFKPWQAVNIAKTIGNVAKVLGPILQIITIIVEVANAHQEAINEKKLSDGRKAVVNDFLKMAQDLERQFDSQVAEVEVALYDSVQKDVDLGRSKEEQAISESNEGVARVIAIRNDMQRILQDIRPVV